MMIGIARCSRFLKRRDAYRQTCSGLHDLVC
jgi:hypothetical protein